jgi:site-specific recombinase XerD
VEVKASSCNHFFESKFDEKTGSSISTSTYAAYCSSWRSFQSYMCDLERANEIQRVFHIRPSKFVNDENSIAVKKSKANNFPKAQALTPEEIASMDEAFKSLILEAYKSRSKSLLPLQRDRVMFHIAIHFALRISELVSLQKQQFSAHYDQRMKHFHNHALLTITGKNSVTGTVPMREPEIYNLLIWYLENIRPKILMRRKDQKMGYVF